MKVGNTPLFRLERLHEPGAADIYVKWEGANPTGSMKDRMALAIIEGAEARGEIKPGFRIVDYTEGQYREFARHGLRHSRIQGP